MRALPIAIVALVCWTAAPAASAPTAWLIPPVDGPIVRRFEAPATSWGPGHRGVDYSVPTGTAVRAVADGTVTFAGNVAGIEAVTIAHDGGVASTYTDLSSVSVAVGDVVEQGYWIGVAGEAHHGIGGMHLGIKVDGEYVDPEMLLGPLDASLAIRLAPLVWEPPSTLPAVFREPFLSARATPTCEPATSSTEVAPNDNIAVLVAGIGSKTAGGTSAALYESGGHSLGYGEQDAYAFSYRGSSGPLRHEPYERSDTFGDIRVAAQRLRALVERVAKDRPGRAVDLIAHSQGGIVARTFLAMSARAWDRDLPPIENLVTFSTPHSGAPIAAAVPVLEGTSKGRAMLLAASAWANNSGPLPDPLAPSVEQLAPGSDLLGRLDAEAVLFGTRVLSLAIANDLVVPADRARWSGYASNVVAPEGWNGHDAIVTSDAATGIARRFLRGGPATCGSGWDEWGPRLGAAIGAVERVLPWLIRR